MNKLNVILLTGLIVFSACAAQPTGTSAPDPTNVPAPTNTLEPTSVPTSIPPTPSPRFVDLKSGGFSLSVQQGLDFDVDDYSINISDKQGELLISLNGKPYISSSYTLESFLNIYLAEMAARGGTLNQGEPYEIIIDGVNGIAVDLSGNFLDNPIAGQAIIISPGKDFIIFGLGMSNLATHENGWAETGSLIFELLIKSIKFKTEVKV